MKFLGYIAMFLTLIVLQARPALSDETSCENLEGLLGMARARSVGALARAKDVADDGYRARTVYAARKFELSANVANAKALLDTIPQNEEQQEVWMTFGDSLCVRESLKEMADLSRFGDRLQADIARAVMLVPARMYQYVFYATLATRDPHSTYAVEMRAVCRRHRSALQTSVEKLAPQERDWFEEHVFDLQRCSPRTLPESE